MSETALSLMAAITFEEKQRGMGVLLGELILRHRHMALLCRCCVRSDNGEKRSAF